MQFLGSTESGVGMPSISKWAEAQKAGAKMKRAETKNNMEKMMATMDAMKIAAEYQQKMEQVGDNEEAKVQLQREMEEATQNTVLRIIWTTTAIDITSTIHETCQMVFFDQAVDKDVRIRRAHAVKNLGLIFQECPPPADDQKDAKTLFEEAAMAAMLETIKRKDEETHAANMH